MAARRPVHPTDAELAILRILWEHGPSTVRQVHEALGANRSTRYTTTLKQLQIMTRKRLVRRNDAQRSHVYTAACDEVSTKASLISSFIDRVCDGSTAALVLQAIEARDVSDSELAEIQRLLREREGAR